MPSISLHPLSAAGRVCIAVPITERTEPDILRMGAELARRDEIDLIEWRADAFEHWQDAGALCRVLTSLHVACKKPLIFTIRTSSEGGLCAPDATQYRALLLAAAKTGCAQFIDVEMFSCPDAQTLTNALHDLGCAVIGSNHDFAKTPPEEELLDRLLAMQALGADVPKLAVMPNTESDVSALMAAARCMRAQSDTPFIALSMGALGQKTRVLCREMGTCMSFGCVGAGSAPGQLEARLLRQALDNAGGFN